jgi:hypothetical protein
MGYQWVEDGQELRLDRAAAEEVASLLLDAAETLELSPFPRSLDLAYKLRCVAAVVMPM